MPKKTLDAIIKSGNHYLVKVKANQPYLLKEVIQIRKSNKVLDSNLKKELNKGRKEQRTVTTYSVNENIANNWVGSKTVIYLRRERRTKKEITITDSYYLSSLNESAKEFSIGIRHHWGIENRLHYVKDVSFKEDASKIRTGNAPAVFSLIRNLIINIARLNGENRIKKFIRQCSGNINLITSYLE